MQLNSVMMGSDATYILNIQQNQNLIIPSEFLYKVYRRSKDSKQLVEKSDFIPVEISAPIKITVPSTLLSYDTELDNYVYVYFQYKFQGNKYTDFGELYLQNPNVLG